MRDCHAINYSVRNDSRGPQSQGPHKAVRGSFKQKSKGYLSQNNTGVPSHWLRAMTIVLASLVTATAVFGAWTLAILKVKRRLENAAAIHRRLDPSRL
jgi:hypothetical protein